MIAAIFISLICHIFCFSNIELTFANSAVGNELEFSGIFFLGPILQEEVYYPESAGGGVGGSTERLNARIFTQMLTPLKNSILIRSSLLTRLRAKFSFRKPLLVNLAPLEVPRYKTYPFRNIISKRAGKAKSLMGLVDNKIAYWQPYLPVETKKAASSIMFYPPMPYHFLLYFKDRQTAHMEVAFYISPEGRVSGLKRKISSGNPEVDLLIMRNLTHFLNLCRTNFALDSWQTVKIDLSP